LAIFADTHAILWLATSPRRLSAAASAALAAQDEDIVVSAVTAYEYSDLNRRRRFDGDFPLEPILAQFGMVVVDYLADAYRIVDVLPDIHRDPVDRMLIAHAIHADLAIVTADATIQSYPVRTIW
jgi:PIN domain nuclease of toxin-antitoxin system